MATFENFILGFMNGKYRPLKSAGVDRILSSEGWLVVSQLGGGLKEERTIATLLCRDKLFAISYLRPDKDELGRLVVWNHTILVPCTEVLNVLKTIWNGNVFIKEPNDSLGRLLPPISVQI